MVNMSEESFVSIMDQLEEIANGLAVVQKHLKDYDDLEQWDDSFVTGVIRPMLEKLGAAERATLDSQELLRPDAIEEASMWDGDEYEY